MRKSISRMSKHICVLILFIFFAFVANAQNTVTGHVTDAKDGSGIADVTVAVKGTRIGTQTAPDGSFTITAPANSHTLVFSAVGFTTREASIAGQSSVNISLQSAASTLSDVVVIGYGTVKKKDLTGSVAQVSSKDFQKGNIVSPDQLIAGKLAGVEVTSNSGAPGAGSTIRIRGGASLNASNDPLIVIDGVPVDNGGISGTANPLSLINPNDIESFSVLKDASAAAIYGSRASNGVIIITTKKGRTGKPVVTFNTSFSDGKIVKKSDVLNADQFRAFVRSHGSSAQQKLLGKYSTDWQDQIYQKALSTDNNLSISGGYKNMPYRVSLGYLNEQGILKTDKLSRYSIGANISPRLLDDHLKIDINIKASISETRFANQGAIGAAVSFDPTKPVYSGSNRFGGYYEYLDSSTVTGLKALAPLNPLGLLMEQNNIGEARRSIGNALIDYKVHFLPDLHVNLNLGYDVATGLGTVYIPDSAASSYKRSPDKEHGGVNNKYLQKKSNKLLEFYLSYAKDINSIKSHIDVVAGYSYQDFLSTNFSFPDYTTDNYVISTPTYPFDKPENVLMSYYGRLNYSFESKYYLTGTIRTDGSSRFNPNNRWGVFPSGAFAWKIKNESFLENSHTVSDLKLRLGYGVTGQQDGIGDYDYISYYGLSDQHAKYQLGNTFYQMFRPGGYYANRKWEQTATTNIALDYGFFNNRVTGSIEYYYKHTTDLLNQITEPAFTNFSNTIVANVGTMDNQGVEFNINIQPIHSKNVTWDVSFNATYNQNKITRLTINDIPNYVSQIAGIGGNGGLQANAVGYARGSFYVFKQVYDKSTGLPIEDLFVDRNSDGLLNTSDLYIFKSPDPKMFYGFSTNLTYKRWNASMTMRADVGNYIYNQVAAGSAISKFVFSAFLSNQNPSVLDTHFQGTGDFYQSNYYVQNGSFLRMDNVNLGYNVGKLSHSKINLRLTASLQNVFVITNYKGLDPEISGGVDNNLYPRPRTFILGAGVDF